MSPQLKEMYEEMHKRVEDVQEITLTAFEQSRLLKEIDFLIATMYKEKVEELMFKHSLGFIHNPGGGEFTHHHPNLRTPCQVEAVGDFKADYKRLLGDLIAAGMEPAVSVVPKVEPICGANYEAGLWSRKNYEAWLEDQGSTVTPVTPVTPILGEGQQSLQWLGCGECDCSFSCHEGQQRCIRLEPPNLHTFQRGTVDNHGVFPLADGMSVAMMPNVAPVARVLDNDESGFSTIDAKLPCGMKLYAATTVTVSDLRLLLFQAAALAVAQERDGRYVGAAAVADIILKESTTK